MVTERGRPRDGTPALREVASGGQPGQIRLAYCASLLCLPPSAHGMCLTPLACRDVGSGGKIMQSETRAGQIAARIDRLPLTPVQWELALLTQIAWGLIVGTDGIAAILYPFLWAPKHTVTSFQYSTIYALEVGIGILIGDYVMGYLGQRFGRRFALLTSAILAGLFIWPFAFVTNFWWLCVFSVLGTLGVGGMLATHATYMAEVLSPQVRGRVQLVCQMVATVIYGVILVGLLPYYMIPDHYREYLFLLAGLQIVVLLPLLYFRLPESPRWLEAHGNLEQAERVMQKMEARVARYVKELPAPDPGHHEVIEVGHTPVMELFQGEYARRTILLLFCWILGYGGIVYGGAAYRLVFIAEHGRGHNFVFGLSLAGAAIGGAALLVNAYWGELVERRDTILLGAVLFTVGWIIAFKGIDNKWLLIIGFFIAGIGTSLWLFNMYTYTANAYPTRLRAVGTGWTDGVGHLGAWLGPVLAGHLYGATSYHVWWIVLIIVPGALLPALVLRGYGVRQRRAILEQLSA
jgi:MFS family permease